jgi:hypothetical protein
MAKRNSKNNGVQLPFNDENFISKWQEWLEYRKERRLASYVPVGLKKTFTKLLNDSQNDPVIAMQIIDHAIANNWQGLHPLKPITNGKTTERFTTKPTATGNVAPGGFGQL